MKWRSSIQSAPLFSKNETERNFFLCFSFRTMQCNIKQRWCIHVSTNYFIYFNIQFHNIPHINDLIFTTSQTLFIFLLISFSIPFSSSLLATEPNKEYIYIYIYIFMPSCHIKLLVLAVHYSKKTKKFCLWLYQCYHVRH